MSILPGAEGTGASVATGGGDAPSPPRRGGDLSTRLWVAGLGIPLAVAALWIGGWVLAVLIGVVALLCVGEFYGLARHRGVQPLEKAGLAATAVLVLAVAMDPRFATLAAWGWGLSVGLVLVALGAAVRRPGPGGAALASASATVAGFLYGGGTVAFAFLLRTLPDGVGGGPLGTRWEGAFLLMFPLIVTWVGDSTAYFVGRGLGRRKLIPTVSPAKTVEGAWGGLAGAVGAALLLHLLVLGGIPGLGLSLPEVLGIGLVLGVAAQVGDLAESVLKREAGVKDSGAVLPGHGGVLDRFDAVLFNLPLCWVLLELGRHLP